MTYWTVMVITILSGYMEGAQVAIPYPSKTQCEAATVGISATLPYDHNMICIASDTPSGSIRPTPRPEGTK